jgi:hypothetical protein
MLSVYEGHRRPACFKILAPADGIHASADLAKVIWGETSPGGSIQQHR